MTEINRAVCVEILQKVRHRIEQGGTHIYVCNEVESVCGLENVAERDFILYWISEQIGWRPTLACWIMDHPDAKNFHQEDDGPGMLETRLAWIDDMIRRFKL